MNKYKVLHLFCGIGGAAVGFQRARAEYKGLLGAFETLAGNSDARWRERIGNMVPVHAAQAIAEEILFSFLASEAKEEFRLNAAGIWVVPAKEYQTERVIS